MRVPGLRIRDCAGSCKSSAQMCTTVYTKDVKAKERFERLYLVPGRGKFVASINCPCASTPPTAHTVTNSRSMKSDLKKNRGKIDVRAQIMMTDLSKNGQN